MNILALALMSVLCAAHTPELEAVFDSPRFKEYFEPRVAAAAKAGTHLFVAGTTQETTDGRTWLKLSLQRQPLAPCAGDLDAPVFVDTLIAAVAPRPTGLELDVLYVQPRAVTPYANLPRR